MNNKICGIYCIENSISGKRYIGQSSDIRRRFREHIQKLRDKKHKNRHIQFSWNEYGESAFKFYVVEMCEREFLDEKERFFIEKYRTMNQRFGYNLTNGGMTGVKISEETRKKMSLKQSGKTLSDEHKRKISKAHKGRKKSFEFCEKMRSRILSSETRKKISLARTGMPGHRHTEEYKKRLSERRKGKSWSEETKKKISNSHKGILRSDDAKRKTSETLTMKWAIRKQIAETLGISSRHVTLDMAEKMEKQNDNNEC